MRSACASHLAVICSHATRSLHTAPVAAAAAAARLRASGELHLAGPRAESLLARALPSIGQAQASGSAAVSASEEPQNK